MNFDGLSNSSLESVIFPCNDQGGREVKSVSRVPEVITHISCRCSSNVRRTIPLLFIKLLLSLLDFLTLSLFGKSPPLLVSCFPLFSPVSCFPKLVSSGEFLV